MKRLKRIVSLILAATMLCTLTPGAFAAYDADDNTAAVSSANSDDEGVINSNEPSDSGGEVGDVPDEGSAGLPDTDVSGSADDVDGVDGVEGADGADNAEPSAPSVNGNSNELSDEGDEIGGGENEPVTVFSDEIVYYVANSTTGGSDLSGDGSEEKPFLTISHAVEQAQANSATQLQIILLSDISSTLELVFDDPDLPITISSTGGTHTIQFTGTRPIGTESGFIRATDGAQLNFDEVTLAGSTGA